MNWEIIHIDETDSTNRWLRDRQQPKESDGNIGGEARCAVAVVADYQTAGRGCGTNTWESERGKNLLFSLLIHPKSIPANRQFLISEWVSVALCELLERYINNKVEIKWPNDIYDKGKKIAGILIENRLQGEYIKDSIVGIGLNVNQQAFHSDAPNPVSLRQLTGHDTDREELLREYLQLLQRVPMDDTIHSKYMSRLFQWSEQKEYQDAAGRFQATITGVEPDGRLIMTDSEGCERRYAFKEVQFVLR